MRCEMVLCVEHGNAMDIKWMPIGAWDEVDEMVDPSQLPKLGILAAAQLDGSIGFYSVPHPDALRQARGLEDDGLPLYRASRLTFDRPKLTCHSQNCSSTPAASR